MNKAIKWGLIICASLVVIVIAGLLIAPAFIDIKDYKPQVEKFVSEKTGRPFAVGDDLSLSLFPWAGVSLSNLQLGNTAGFAEKDFVTVKSFEVRVKLLPLISKEIQVKRFIVNEPHIILIKNKDGRVNWSPVVAAKSQSKTEKPEGKSPEAAVGSGLPIKDLTVGDFSIKNGSLEWIDRAAGVHKKVTAFTMGLQDVSFERPVKLSLSAQLDNQPLALKGTIGPIGKDFKQATIPLDLDIEALTELALKLNGSLKNPGATPGFALAVDIRSFSPRKLMTALGQDFPVATADPKALNQMALKAELKGNPSRITISNGLLNLDESKMNFSINASEFSKPNLAFEIDLDRIDLDRYLPPPSDRPAADKRPAEKKQTDYTPLRKLILDGRVKIGQLIVSKARIQDLVVGVSAKNGIINLDPVKLNMYQGNVSGIGQLNVQGNTPRSNVDLDVKNIQAGPLLKDVLQKDMLEGTTHARIALSMDGDDAAVIKKTLTGNGQVLFNDGAIVGIDLAGMVRNVKAAFALEQKPAQRPRTDFSELIAPFTLRNGVFNTTQTSLKSPLIRLLAAGNADLVKETLDFRVEPKLVATIKGQGDTEQRSGLMVPVLVSGTFAKPKFAPDLAGIAKKQLEETLLGPGQDQPKLDKKNLEDAAKGVLKGLLGD
jgi:AsmA protein